MCIHCFASHVSIALPQLLHACVRCCPCCSGLLGVQTLPAHLTPTLDAASFDAATECGMVVYWLTTPAALPAKPLLVVMEGRLGLRSCHCSCFLSCLKCRFCHCCVLVAGTFRHLCWHTASVCKCCTLVQKGFSAATRLWLASHCQQPHGGLCHLLHTVLCSRLLTHVSAIAYSSPMVMYHYRCGLGSLAAALCFSSIAAGFSQHHSVAVLAAEVGRSLGWHGHGACVSLCIDLLGAAGALAPLVSVSTAL